MGTIPSPPPALRGIRPGTGFFFVFLSREREGGRDERPFLTHFFILISVVVALAACAPAAQEPEAAAEEPPSTEADVEAINEVLEQEVAAVSAGDVEAFVALFTDDAVLMAPGEPAVIGKAALRSWAQDLVDQFTIEYTASSEEIVLLGDWAFQRASITLTLTPKAGGDPIGEGAKGIHIFQRQPDGSWKIARDNWNSDNPPPGSEWVTALLKKEFGV